MVATDAPSTARQVKLTVAACEAAAPWLRTAASDLGRALGVDTACPPPRVHGFCSTSLLCGL